MYTPPLFKVEDLPEIHAAMRFARLATLVTHGPEGLLGTPLPVVLEAGEGPYGTLYCHVAKANSVWREAAAGEAMAIFMGPDTYVTPSWYATKALTHKVVPTWNYVAVHAYGPIETFDDPERLHAHVSALTGQFEAERTQPWAVTDAPEAFVQSQLKGIVGLRMPITRLDAKRKMSQNRPAEDRAGVIAGLSGSDDPRDHAVAGLITP